MRHLQQVPAVDHKHGLVFTGFRISLRSSGMMFPKSGYTSDAEIRNPLN